MNHALAMDERSLTATDSDDVTDEIAVVGKGLARALAWPVRMYSSAQPAWLTTVSCQLRAIQGLSQNWDSSGGAPPKPQTLMAAQSLLQLIAANTSDVDKPHISPTPVGGVQFDWQSGNRYLEVEVTDPNSAHYYFEDRDACNEAEGTILLGESINPIVSLLRRVESNW